ncbi:phosphoribosylformylglycinamidine synthase [Thermodesulfovibrio yellowstonii]|uniref:Phosphoribosylformylglycinamidine synthase n=1 Tax=Thermodesulfovibrio yellowstonii TaxID=28262 RepID=A0A9W6LKU5_9BACT|nr:phosphoribosylformylglycinamidine synthase [Thermodesulfovibrio islandicus]GLI54002.1 phosphoribosylformylglycinamidine synthase [Thermodesulfovibrio islandicus]
MILKFYRKGALSEYKTQQLLKRINSEISDEIKQVETEFCYYILTDKKLSEYELTILKWLLAETFEPENFSDKSFLSSDNGMIFEVGPRLNFSTAWSTCAVSVCHSIGINKIQRIERSRRYKLIPVIKNFPTKLFLDMIHDRMVECPYPEPLKDFSHGISQKPLRIVPVLEEGKKALEKINHELGLGWDEWDIDFYLKLFRDRLKRNPTDVECFDLAQSNSEHSRHWFFRGTLFIDGKPAEKTLFDIVKEPLNRNPKNSVIAFKDNSSAIYGTKIGYLKPEIPGKSCRFAIKRELHHLIFTAETHNFPTGVAPFPGAETGTGGRIRDVHATGKGAIPIAGTAAYCVGNLYIPNYELSWEDKSFKYPSNLATPLQIEIEASNGASDYGNKFGEPVIAGFTRSFGMRLPDGERVEWIKPIMFTGGIGQINAIHTEKDSPKKGMYVVKIGGPAYRIGMGGGAASSVVSGELSEELDFNAVQRGDAEMENKLNRVVRACVELGKKNPIVSIHDQGAGGNCNVVKELVYPEGAKIDIRKVILGDETLSVLEIWGAEYQENDAILIEKENVKLFDILCKRERLPWSIIGEVTGDGKLIVYDSKNNQIAVNFDLKDVLGEIPKKEFRLQTIEKKLKPLKIPETLTLKDALNRVLRLLSVGSKRFLTNKVDRSVTGLIVRQQCAGPVQLTVSDVCVVAQSYFNKTGIAHAIGEQPIKGLINPEAMARLSVTEALTNIVWAKITDIQDIKCSANWMWAAKLPGEGVRLYKAAQAMAEFMIKLGIAIDGGKDSLSMAAKVKTPDGVEVVKSPGSLVISAYAPCPDIHKIITPDIKSPGKSVILFIDLSNGKKRLGGTALAQCMGQLGDETPDMENPELLKRSFRAIQTLIDKKLILSGHDRSDGGLITTLLEMAFSGSCGLHIKIKEPKLSNIMAELFNEEPGLAIEVDIKKLDTVEKFLIQNEIPFYRIADTLKENKIIIEHANKIIFDEPMTSLRDIWEETSYRLDMLQANPECVEEEKKSIYGRIAPHYKLSFTPERTPEIILKKKAKPLIAIIREEGSNGDREMAAAFYMAGFEPWDVCMQDLIDKKISLKKFKGIAFVGGFSFADVLDSAKGWAGCIKFSHLKKEFEDFYMRNDTFSLGVCNGCQLMALLGWVPWYGIEELKQPRFIWNKSGRFESRWVTVKILPSPSIMLKDMEDSQIGVWIAHGEGRAYFPDETILSKVLEKNLAPVRYVDDSGNITETYPFNPNNSPYGITALCSEDGRHLAMMPHPERTFLLWQLPWLPQDWKKLKASPWLKLFQNARLWCDNYA